MHRIWFHNSVFLIRPTSTHDNTLQVILKISIFRFADPNYCLSTWFWHAGISAGMYHSWCLACLPSTPVPSTRCIGQKKSRYLLAINIFEFSDDVHLISLKSRLDACLEYELECQVTVLWKLKFIFSKQKNCRIQTP